jgi:hypothetical protein
MTTPDLLNAETWERCGIASDGTPQLRNPANGFLCVYDPVDRLHYGADTYERVLVQRAQMAAPMLVTALKEAVDWLTAYRDAINEACDTEGEIDIAIAAYADVLDRARGVRKEG